MTLREAREAAGLTQTEAAKRIGLPQPKLSEYEAKQHMPGAHTFLKLCRLYGVDPREVDMKPKQDKNKGE